MADTEVKIKFTAESDGLKKEFDGVNQSLAEQAAQAKKTAEQFGWYTDAQGRMRDSSGRFVSAARQAEAGIEGVGNAAAETAKQTQNLDDGLKAIAASGAAVAGGIALLGLQATQTGIQFQTLKTALTTSLGSESEAEAAFNTILQFAKETPFQVQEITSAFVKLQNQGINPSTENLKKLGDIAASQGKSFEQITEAILDAANSEGERLKEFGIRASFAGKQAEIAFKDVNLQVEKTPQAITEAILSLGELKGVAGGMEAQSKTLGGALSNLQDNADQASLAFFEMSGGAIKSVVDAANSLLSGFVELNPAMQKIIFTTAGLTAAIAAAVAVTITYNFAMKSATATQLALLLTTTKTTIATTAATAANVAAALATNTLTVAQARFITGLVTKITLLKTLALQLAVLVAAVEVLQQSFNILADGGEETNKRLLEFQRGIEGIGEAVEKTDKVILKPRKAGFFDIFRTGAQNNIDDTRIAIEKFSNGVLTQVDQLGKLGDSAEDVKKKQEGFLLAQKSVAAELAALDEEKLGTAAYEELRGRLEVTQKALESQGRAYGLVSEGATTATATTEDLNKSLEDQTKILEDQRAKEKESTAETRAEDQIKLARQIEDEKAARQEENQKILNDRQLEFEATKATAQTEFQESQQAELDQRELERLELQRATEDADRAEAKAFDQELNDQKAVFEESERDKTETFTTEIEAIKKQASEERLLAEKKLADEIAQRQAAQSAGFSQAARTAGKQAQLLALETEEERQQLIKDFEAQRRVEANVAALELANKTLNAKGILKLAAEVANVGVVKTEEDAKKVQEAIALIQEQQQKQQAEADKKAEEELRLKIAADEEALQLKLQTAAETFELAQESRKLAFEDTLAAKREERELALIERGRARQDEERLNQEIFDAAREAKQLEFQARIDSAQKEFDAQQAKIQEDFTDSEQADQRAFEDEQRAKEKAFNESERLKDEESARRIAAIKARIVAPATGEDPELTNIDGALAEGGAVVAGKTYLVGENNPEPLVFNNGKMAMVGTGGAQLITPTQSGYVYPNLAALPSGDVVSEIKALRNDIQNTPRSFGASTYNIVGAQDPVRAAIKLQQERIKQRARMARI